MCRAAFRFRDILYHFHVLTLFESIRASKMNQFRCVHSLQFFFFVSLSASLPRQVSIFKSNSVSSLLSSLLLSLSLIPSLIFYPHPSLTHPFSCLFLSSLLPFPSLIPSLVFCSLPFSHPFTHPFSHPFSESRIMVHLDSPSWMRGGRSQLPSTWQQGRARRTSHFTQTLNCYSATLTISTL